MQNIFILLALLLCELYSYAQPNDRGDSSLHLAVMGSGPEAVRVVAELIDNGADIEARNNFGQTPLFYASLFWEMDDSKLQIITNLLLKGASLQTKIKDETCFEALKKVYLFKSEGQVAELLSFFNRGEKDLQIFLSFLNEQKEPAIRKDAYREIILKYHPDREVKYRELRNFITQKIINSYRQATEGDPV